MTDSAFPVGQRVHWLHEHDERFGHHCLVVRAVHSGMVMSTGPAVTTVWNDNHRDPRDHHQLTFANDKVWADRAIPLRIMWERNQADQEARHAAENSNPKETP